MHLFRRFFAPVLLVAFAAPTSAFMLRTEAVASAGACCRPDGSSHGFASFTFTVRLSDVEEQFFGRQLAYTFQTNDECGFLGVDFIVPQTRRVEITDAAGAMITTFVNSPPLECFFNARARSVARFSTDTKRSTSLCQKPCPDCVPWGS